MMLEIQLNQPCTLTQSDTWQLLNVCYLTRTTTALALIKGHQEKLMPTPAPSLTSPPAQTNLLFWTNGGSLQVLGIQWVNVAEVGAG